MEDNRNQNDEVIKDYGEKKTSADNPDAKLVSYTLIILFLAGCLMPIIIFGYISHYKSTLPTDFEEFDKCSVHLSHDGAFEKESLEKREYKVFNTDGTFPLTDIYGNSRHTLITNVFCAYFTTNEELLLAEDRFGMYREDIYMYDEEFFKNNNLAMLLSYNYAADPYAFVYVGNKKENGKEYIQFEKSTIAGIKAPRITAHMIVIDKDVPFVAFELKTNNIPKP